MITPQLKKKNSNTKKKMADHRASPGATAAASSPFYPVAFAFTAFFATDLTTKETIKGIPRDVAIVPYDVPFTHKSIGTVRVPVRNPIRGVAFMYLSYRFFVAVSAPFDF
jgi:hypothetical protein